MNITEFRQKYPADIFVLPISIKVLVFNYQFDFIQTSATHHWKKSDPAVLVISLLLGCARISRQPSQFTSMPTFSNSPPQLRPRQIPYIQTCGQRPLCRVWFLSFLNIDVHFFVQFADSLSDTSLVHRASVISLHMPHRYSCQIHCNENFLNAAFTTAIPLNDCGLTLPYPLA